MQKSTGNEKGGDQQSEVVHVHNGTDRKFRLSLFRHEVLVIEASETKCVTGLLPGVLPGQYGS